MQRYSADLVKLPEPKYNGDVSIEEALLGRRSARRYTRDSLTVAEVSQLLWAAQGITRPERGYRTAPSAGALFPLETYLVAGAVGELASGIYKYIVTGHELAKVVDGDMRDALASAALGQRMAKNAPVSMVIAAVFARTTDKYGERGIRYVHMDVAHAGQNIYLQAVSLGLGTVVVGAFDDGAVKVVLQLPSEEYPLYIMPVGRPQK